MNAATRPVLHLSTERGWRGGEHQVLLLATGLAVPPGPAGQGSAQVVAAPARSPLLLRVAQAGVATMALHPNMPLHPTNLWRLFGWLRRNPLAIVHAHTSPALSLISVVRHFAPPAAVVFTRRVAFPVRPSRKYRTAADRYVAISAAVAKGLVAAGTAPERVSIISSAVEVDRLDMARPDQEIKRSAAQPRVGCVGHMSAEKGQSVLLAAWAKVVQELPAGCLILVGDGPRRRDLQRLAAALPPDRVLFTGFRDDIPSLMATFDLYVQPSLSEGLGTSVLDAMACRLPVIASATGGLPEVVEQGKTGVLVAPNNPDALAAAMLDLLRHRERALAMGKAGRARVAAEFTVPRMVASHAKLYCGLARRDYPAVGYCQDGR